MKIACGIQLDMLRECFRWEEGSREQIVTEQAIQSFGCDMLLACGGGA